MNIKKNNSTIITIIIGIVMFLIVIFIFLYINNQKENTALKEYECLKKGKLCDSNEIYDGIEVEVEVKNNVKYRFYMISNTEEEITLIMANNIIDKVDWHVELINMKGPGTALGKIFEETKTWEKISNIQNYTYDDYGLKNFIESCKTDTPEPNYDCNSGNIRGRGYKSLQISNNKIELIYNMDEIDGIEPAESFSYSQIAKARLITLEEITNIAQEKELPKWLTDNLNEKEGYWTMTSSTAMNTQYSSGAIAIANVENKSSIESLYVLNSFNKEYKIGIRPVITIAKK